MTRHKPKTQSTCLVAIPFALLIYTLLSVSGCQGKSEPDNKNNTTTSAKSPFSTLDVQGPELHPSLRNPELDSIQNVPQDFELPSNPYISDDPRFVKGISRGGSQGRLESEGIGSAYYARYETEENEMGIYGLYAKSSEDADKREKAVRDIWAHNGSFGRSRVYRNGLTILIAWHDGMPAELWESVNANLAERVKALPEK